MTDAARRKMRERAWIEGAAAAGLLLGTVACQPPRPALPEPPPVQLSIQPEAATVTAGHELQFGYRISSGGTPAVTWRVVEPDGGTLDGQGRYRAPVRPGTWTVEVGSVADPSRTARARVTVVPPPRGPVSAPGSVAPGASGLPASVPPQPGSHYDWSLDGGAVLSGAGTDHITFRVGDGPSLAIHCRVTNAAGDSLASTLDIPVSRPVPLAIAPTRAILTVGRAMTFGTTLPGRGQGVVWRVEATEGGSVDAAGHYRAPAEPGLYTLQVAPAGDPGEAAQARIKVVPAPVAPITAPATLAAGQAGLKARVPRQPGATYAWEVRGGTLTGGQHGPEVTFTAGSGPTLTLRCTVTNEAGDSFTGSLVLPVGK